MLHPPGTRLGPYEIASAVGAGGMGDVYKARDTRLKRTVAVKVAKEQFEERFRSEALTVAALNHPHICTLFDVGPDYLVMEYVEGKALRGPLPGPSAAPGRRDRRRPRARPPPRRRPPRPQALEHPADEGGVKVIDFGLAKRRSAVPGDGREPPDADRGRGDPRNAAVHGPGADRREAGRRAHGHLRFRPGAVRDADRPARLRGQERGQRDGGDPGTGSRADLGPDAADAAGARAGGADLPGQGPGRALAVGPGAEARAGVGRPCGLRACRRSAALEDGHGRRSDRPRFRGHRVCDRPSQREASQAPPRPARNRPAREVRDRPAAADGRLARRRADCAAADSGRRDDAEAVHQGPRFRRPHARAWYRKRHGALLVPGWKADRFLRFPRGPEKGQPLRRPTRGPVPAHIGGDKTGCLAKRLPKRSRSWTDRGRGPGARASCSPSWEPGQCGGWTVPSSRRVLEWGWSRRGRLRSTAPARRRRATAFSGRPAEGPTPWAISIRS